MGQLDPQGPRGPTRSLPAIAGLLSRIPRGPTSYIAANEAVLPVFEARQAIPLPGLDTQYPSRPEELDPQAGLLVSPEGPDHLEIASWSPRGIFLEARPAIPGGAGLFQSRSQAQTRRLYRPAFFWTPRVSFVRGPTLAIPARANSIPRSRPA